MTAKKATIALGIVTLSALGLSACAGGSTTGNASAIITTNGGEPQKALLPGLTGEVNGGKILSLIGEGLYYYDVDGNLKPALVDQFETSDQQTYKISIQKGKKFDDGTEIKAKNFVDAWTYTALAKNAQDQASWMDIIDGADSTNAGLESVSGLKVIDDHTFEVKLKNPVSDFQKRLGYTVFQPLSDKALADPKANGENPTANGPYKLAKAGAWEHNKQIELVKNPEYKGPQEAKNGGVTIKFYTDMDAAYADAQSNNLDILDSIPASAQKNFANDFAGRTETKDGAVNQTLAIDTRMDHFKMDEEGKLRRAAISKAINRESVTSAIFNSQRVPSKDFTTPTMQGYKSDLPGADVLNFDAAKAKELWAQADAINKWDNPKFEIAYNGDGGHKAWVEATVNQIKENLGIEAAGKPMPTFKEMLDQREAGTLGSAVRAGWQADYPSMGNFLEKQYKSTASSNYEKYNSPDFDAKIEEANKAANQDDNTKFLNEAQEILFKDLPQIPLWTYKNSAVWSDKVDNVKLDWKGVIDYSQVTAK